MIETLLKSLNLDENAISQLKTIMPQLNIENAENIGQLINTFLELKDGKILLISKDYVTDVEVNDIERTSLLPLMSTIPVAMTLNNNFKGGDCNKYNLNTDVTEILDVLTDKTKKEEDKMRIIGCILNDISKSLTVQLLSGDNKVTVNNVLYYVLQVFYFTNIMTSKDMRTEILNVLDKIRKNEDIEPVYFKYFPVVSAHLIAMRYKEKALKEGKVNAYTTEEFSKMASKYNPETK